MINRDELLKMAREAGFQTGYVKLSDGLASYPIVMHTGNHCTLEVERLINIVLERAAVECENQADRFMQGSPLEGNKPYASHECAAAIRALKTQGE